MTLRINRLLYFSIYYIYITVYQIWLRSVKVQSKVFTRLLRLWAHACTYGRTVLLLYPFAQIRWLRWEYKFKYNIEESLWINSSQYMAINYNSSYLYLVSSGQTRRSAQIYCWLVLVQGMWYPPPLGKSPHTQSRRTTVMLHP